MPHEIETHDEQTIWRCPMLGGPVPFRHCRKVNDGLPCRQIIGCWGGRIELAAFLNENYSREELERALGAPKKSRIDTIIETLERTQAE